MPGHHLINSLLVGRHIYTGKESSCGVGLAGRETMSTSVNFHDLAQQVRNLLDCDAVGLVPGCPEMELRHPLLDLFPVVEDFHSWCYSSKSSVSLPDLTTLLHEERIRALCDIAIQTGQMQCIDSLIDVDKRIGYALADQSRDRSFASLRMTLPTGWSEEFVNLHQLPGATESVQSVAVVPLERPAGLLGLLLLVDHRADAFSRGERLLLESHLPLVLRKLEKDLRHLPGQSNQVNQKTAEQEREGYPQEAPLQHEFVSIVGHELRTPLSAIKGYAGLLQAYSIPGHPGQSSIQVEEMTPLRQQQYLDSIMEQTRHLEVLIEDVLDISRLQAGRLVLRPTKVNIALLCQRVVQLIQHRADQQESEKHQMRCLLAPELPLAWADPDRVQQVLTNLLENAIKYSPDGGLIEVLVSAPCPLQPSHKEILSRVDVASTTPCTSCTFCKPLMLHITVRDQGIGISRKHQSLLFRPFSRLEHATTHPIPGVGLGLYITQKLVEAMGGNITLCSSEGSGTSVSFTLPTVLTARPAC